MKLLMTLLVGGVLGAAGYWWLERTAPEAKVEHRPAPWQSRQTAMQHQWQRLLQYLRRHHRLPRQQPTRRQPTRRWRQRQRQLLMPRHQAAAC